MSDNDVVQIIAGVIILVMALMIIFGEGLGRKMRHRREDKARRKVIAATLADIKRKEDEQGYRDALSREDWDYKYLRRLSEDDRA